MPLPEASCEALAAGGAEEASVPVLTYSLADRWHEGWLASPALADLDEDGQVEIVVARDELVLVWHADGSEVWRQSVGGRIWASPVVGDLLPEQDGLEVAVASRGRVYLFDATGELQPGYPFEWRDELRALAAGDVDADGRLELVVMTTSPQSSSGLRDVVMAIEAATADPVSGFPPNASGSGCDDSCVVTGGYDQNLAVGDVDGDGSWDILATQDNAYLSLHHGSGEIFAAADVFPRPYFPGIRFLHDYEEAQKGYADDEETANQAHFTNSAPAIADLDGDGDVELVVLASVQNAAQTDRERGVALWVIGADGRRPEGWLEPFHAPDYLAGLGDFEGTNTVGATNQVSVADINSDEPGREVVFAGFDGRIHAVSAGATELWAYRYTDDDRVLTAGVAVADLSGDGRPEVVFASYSPDDGKSKLFVLDAAGNLDHAIDLPGRGSMAVPSIGDVDGDGALDIAVALKGGEDGEPQVLVYRVEGSAENCVLWGTGRGTGLRNGYAP